MTPKDFLGLMDTLFLCTVVLMRCTLEYSKVGEILLLNHTSKGITGISIKISLLQIIVKGVDFNEVEKQQCDIVCK